MSTFRSVLENKLESVFVSNLEVYLDLYSMVLRRESSVVTSKHVVMQAASGIECQWECI